MNNHRARVRNPRTKAILEDIKKGQLTYAEIGRKHRLSRQRVDQIAQKHGVVSPLLLHKRQRKLEREEQKRTEQRKRRDRERNVEQTIVRLHLDDKSEAFIARKLQKSPGTVHLRVQRLGLKFRCPKRGDITKETEKALVLLANRPNMRAIDVANEAGCSPTTVFNLRRNGGTKHHRITDYFGKTLEVST